MGSKRTTSSGTVRGMLVAVAAMAFASAVRAEDVSIGVLNTAADAPVFIAEANGYFRDEGLTVKLVEFNGAAKMVGPLGTGELDAGGGAISVGFYNAVERGIDLKIVADKAHAETGYDFASLLVRKELHDSGRFKGYQDLKGLKIAISAAGAADESVVNEALKKGGLKWGDATIVYLGFPQHPAAYANGAIDASITNEPTLTFILRAHSAVEFKEVSDFYPNHQTSVLIYGMPFIEKRHATAKKFMRAYLRGARFYNQALAGGHLAGPKGPDVISILTKYSRIKDPELYKAIRSQACDPNGTVNVTSLEEDWAFFKDTGQISGKVTVTKVIDMSFAEAAVASLGPAKISP